MEKIIKGTKINIEGNHAKATYDGLHIFEGRVEKGMTHERLYQELYADIIFKYNGKQVWSIDKLYSDENQIKDITRRLAKKHNCKREDIEIRIKLAKLD